MKLFEKYLNTYSEKVFTRVKSKLNISLVMNIFTTLLLNSK